MDNVTILLSTFNGEKFLGDQLKSIFLQERVNIHLYSRDDGSTDDTVDILENYLKGNNIYRGSNIGVTKSFLTLNNLIPDKTEYYAFADQDDYWCHNKLIRAIDMIKSVSKSSIPTMYCSRVEYVDEDLKHLGYSPTPTRISLANALVENIAIGCTMVINRPAKALISEAIPQHALMHDWWTYLIMSALGKVIYDAWPSMKYRQHNQNAVGGTDKIFLKNIKKILPFIRNVCSEKSRTTHQAAEFKTLFDQYLNSEQRAIINEFVYSKGDVSHRVKLAFSRRFNRHNAIDNLFYKIQILLGKY